MVSLGRSTSVPSSEPTGVRRPGRPFYGWVLVAASFTCLAISSGVWYSFQVMFLSFLEEFGAGRSQTALVFSLCVLVYNGSSPLVGLLNDRFGPRRVVPLGGLVIAIGLVASSRAHSLEQLYFTYGVVVALGIALIDPIPIFSMLSNWFVGRRGAAIGIAASGTGVAMVVFLPLTQHLASSYGWRQAYLVLAAVSIAVISPLAALLFRRRPEEMGLLPDGGSPATVTVRAQRQSGRATDWTAAAALRHPMFWPLSLGFAIAPLSTSTVLTHQVAFMVDAGLAPALAAAVAGLTGIGGTFGRAGLTTLSDRIGRVPAYALGVAAIVVGVGALHFGGTGRQLGLLYLYAATFGSGYGVAGPLFAATAADTFHGRSFGTIYGLMRVGSGLGGALGPWLAGYVFDVTGSYLPTFGLAAAAGVATWVSLWLACRPHRTALP